MLTRDSERVFEILLISVGLTLTVLFHQGPPGFHGTAENATDRSGGSIFLQVARHVDAHGTAGTLDQSSPEPPSPDSPTRLIEQALRDTRLIEQTLRDTVGHLGALGRPTGRC